VTSPNVEEEEKAVRAKRDICDKLKRTLLKSSI